MNVKFHKNCDDTGKILKISCVRCNSVKFDFHFLRVLPEIFFGVTTDDLLPLVQDFCALKIEITQFPAGFRLKLCARKDMS